MITKYSLNSRVFYEVRACYTNEQSKVYRKKTKFNEEGERISSLKKAELVKHKIISKLEQDHSLRLHGGNFRRFFNRYLKEISQIRTESTIENRRSDLIKVLDDNFWEKSIRDITRGDALKLIFEDLPKMGKTPHGQKRILIHMKDVMSFALRKGAVPFNPFSDIVIKIPPKEKKVLNAEEAQKLLEEAKKEGHPYYHLWALALYSGMRNCELYALRWKNIDMSEKVIEIQSSWTKKNGYHATKANRNRQVAISSALEKILLELKDLGPFEETLQGLKSKSRYFDDLVLPRCPKWRDGKQAEMTRQFCHKIGVEEVEFHDLRATFITHLLRVGAPTPQVMSFVGHETVNTTDEYVRLAGVNGRGMEKFLSYKLPA